MWDLRPLGSFQSCLAEFCYYKEKKKSKNNNGSKNDLLPVRGLNYEEECERLVEGFKKKVGSSKILNFVMDTFSTVKLPEWQKSKYWIVSADFHIVSHTNFPRQQASRFHWNRNVPRPILPSILFCIFVDS